MRSIVEANLLLIEIDSGAAQHKQIEWIFRFSIENVDHHVFRILSHINVICRLVFHRSGLLDAMSS